jgi:hypothetical protein
MMSFNYTGIALSVVFSIMLGFFWYSVVFGKAWMKLMGMDPNAPKPSGAVMAKSILLGAFSSLLKAAIFYIFLEAAFLFKGPSLESGLFVSALLWIGCSFPNELNRVAWEMKSWKFVLINGSYEALRLIGLALIFWYSRPA